MTTVALLGGGKLARASLALLKRGGATVTASVRDKAQVKALEEGGAVIAPARDAVRDAHVVVLAVPAGAFVDVVDAVSDVARGDQIILHAARGLGPDAMLPSEMIRRASCWKKIAALGGPLYVDDAAHGRQLSAAIASRFDEAVRAVKALTQGTVRFSSTRDVIGVEVAGALSNVGHLAAGLAKGAGLGDTDQSLLTVRALLEAARFGVSVGADRATFNGLAGVGDLIPRNITSTRVHRSMAEEWAKGGDVNATVLAALEGAVTAREVAAQAKKSGLDLPLVCAVDDVLAGRQQAQPALLRVLSLELGLQAA